MKAEKSVKCDTTYVKQQKSLENYIFWQKSKFKSEFSYQYENCKCTGNIEKANACRLSEVLDETCFVVFITRNYVHSSTSNYGFVKVNLSLFLIHKSKFYISVKSN